jgi:hypothetical protein
VLRDAPRRSSSALLSMRYVIDGIDEVSSS